MKLEKWNLDIPIEEEEKLSLFPSVGEYPVYDTNSYLFMQADKQIEKMYKNALSYTCRNKDVIDIGTGQFMDWAMYALYYGASSATGVEVIKETFELAKLQLSKEPKSFQKRMTLINALSFDFNSDKKFDVCVSEVIGCIGGSEGAAKVILDAKERLLKPKGKVIPFSCLTKVGGICLRDLLPEIKVHKDSLTYLNQIFELNGGPFDVRLTLTHNMPEAVITTHGVVETLNFEGDLKLEDIEQCQIVVEQNGKIDGVLLWIDLLVDKFGKSLDSLKTETGWEVVYFPLFDTPVEVKKGDLMNISFERKLSKDNVHPDYFIKCDIETLDGRIFSESFNSPHYGNNFHTKDIYKQIFKKY